MTQTSQQVKRLLNIRVQKVCDNAFFIGVPDSSYQFVHSEKKTFDELVDYGICDEELRGIDIGPTYFGAITLKAYDESDKVAATEDKTEHKDMARAQLKEFVIEQSCQQCCRCDFSVFEIDLKAVDSYVEQQIQGEQPRP